MAHSFVAVLFPLSPRTWIAPKLPRHANGLDAETLKPSHTYKAGGEALCYLAKFLGTVPYSTVQYTRSLTAQRRPCQAGNGCVPGMSNRVEEHPAVALCASINKVVDISSSSELSRP